MAFTGAPFIVRWNYNGLVSAVFLGTADGNDDDLAHLEIAITTQPGISVVSDTVGGNEPMFIGALALMGGGRRWFMLSRAVRTNEEWTIQLRNTWPDPDRVIVPELVFEVTHAEAPP